MALGCAIALTINSPSRSADPLLAATTVPLTQLACPEARQVAALIRQDTDLFETSLAAGDHTALLTAIDHSLAYLQTPGSLSAYSNYSVPGVTHSTASKRSLIRFRTLLLQSHSADELQQAVAAEFDFYQAVGQDNAGTVAFTGYFEPTYTASRLPTAEYRYPNLSQPG